MDGKSGKYHSGYRNGHANLAYEYPTARWLDVLASRTDAAASRAEREAVAQILGCIG